MQRFLCTSLMVFIGLVSNSSFAKFPIATDDVKIEKAVFARGIDKQGKPVSPGNVFRPTDKIVLIATLNSRPESGTLSCRFSYGKQEITVVSVELETLKDKDFPSGTNAYGEFTLSPVEPFPAGDQYRAEVSFNKKSLGEFKFSVRKARGNVGDKSSGTLKTQESISAKTPEKEKTGGNAGATERAGEKSTKEIVDMLLQGTAHVEGEDENGRGWTGTAWLLDEERRLLITNDHVANASAHDSRYGNVKSMHVYFPEYRNGRVIHEESYYKKNVEPIAVKVLYGDEKQDLAILQAETLPENVKALPLAPESVQLGESLYSLGGIPRGSEGFWIYTSGEVRAVYQRSLANGYEAETVEADMQTNQGNSGGPVVNNRGELVAVVEGHMTVARSVSLYIDLTEVRSFIDVSEPLVDPQSIEQLVKRGEHHFESGRMDQALEDFTKVLRKDPQHAYAMSSRGWVFYHKEDYETAVAEFGDAIAADKTMLYAYRGRAMVELDNGEFERAIADLTHAIRNATDKEELAEFYNERGVAHSRVEDFEKALRDFDRSIDADPTYSWGHANRGHMLTELGDYTDAIDALKRAVELEPTEAEFFGMMAKAAHMLDNHEGALKLYSIAIETNPYEADFLVQQAKCLAALDRYEEAGTSLKAAVDLDSRNDRIHNEVGVVAFELGSYLLAYTQFREATDLNPDDYLYWFNRGHAASKMGETEVAINDLSESLRREEDPDAYVLRGNAYSLSSQPREAVSDFDNARRIAPDAFRKYTTKYFRITNSTPEPLNVFVRYYTKGTDGKFHWYPTSGEGLRYEFAPGESSGIKDGKQLIHGSRFHIWAEGLNTGETYLTYKNKELVMVGDAGYLTDIGEPESETYEISPEE